MCGDTGTLKCVFVVQEAFRSAIVFSGAAVSSMFIQFLSGRPLRLLLFAVLSPVGPPRRLVGVEEGGGRGSSRPDDQLNLSQPPPPPLPPPAVARAGRWEGEGAKLCRVVAGHKPTGCGRSHLDQIVPGDAAPR